MTDPANALDSFQKALSDGHIQPEPGFTDPELYYLIDSPLGVPRFSYVRLDGKTVTAFVEFVKWEPIDGVRCFNIGYAVPESRRGQGRATEVVSAAIKEVQYAMGKIGISSFYVEAMVSKDNVASQRVAAKTISEKPVETTDNVSGLPALRYVRKIESA